MILLAMVSTMPFVRVWERDVTVGQLARRLGYSVDAKVADRHLALFAQAQQPADIAKQVAECMGLKVVGSRFVADPAYERLIAGYEPELKAIAIAGIRKAAAQLRADPPKRNPKPRPGDPMDTWIRPKMDYSWLPGRGDSDVLARAKAVDQCSSRIQRNTEVSLLLSRCSAVDLQNLLDGHFVVGSTPHLGNTVRLPGSPKDYFRFEGASRGYVATRFDSTSLFVCSYTPGQESPNAGSDSVVFGNSGLYGAPAETSKLGRWCTSWAPRQNATNLHRFNITFPAGEIDHGEILERLARRGKVPVVAERMPWSERGPSIDWMRPATLVREKSGWLQIKPATFWRASEIWAKRKEVLSMAQPKVADPISALDWAARLSLNLQGRMSQYLYSLKAMHFNFEAFGYQPALARFWMSLSRTEKASLLTRGMACGELSPQSRTLLQDAAIQCILANSLPKGDVSAWLERSSACKVVVESTRALWLRSPTGGSSMGGTKEQVERQLRANRRPGDHLYDALTFTFRFVSPKGVCTFEARVFELID